MSAAVASGRGLPELERIIMPASLDSLPEGEVRAYVNERLQEICNRLTSNGRPAQAQRTKEPKGQDIERVSLSDDVELVGAYFYERGWTDGLPVVPPTEERVARMVAGSAMGGPALVANVPPQYGGATVESIAVNAVMAGCRPEYMPVVMAAVKALCDPAVHIDGIQVTTNPMGPAIIVNGPVRAELDINCGTNVFGPGRQANAAIGRAVRLILLNIGGATPGTVDQATQGFPGKYGICIGENEEQSPWESLHVERGFLHDQSTVTVAGVNGSVNLHDSGADPEGVLLSITYGMRVATSSNFISPNSHPIVILNPDHARMLNSIGHDKQRLKEHLYQHVRVPIEWLSQRRRDLRLGETDVLDIDGMVPVTGSPENFVIVVAGGMQGLHSTFLPSGFGESVTALIESP